MNNQNQFELYSSLDYLKIATANHKGLDKVNFSDRIDWFNNNIGKLDLTSLSETEVMQEIDLYLQDEQVDEPNGFKASILAYRDYQMGNPSGYMISLDAACSGMQLMSALSACPQGLNLTTGYRDNKRMDAYTEVYQLFLQFYGNKNDKTRKECKEAIMPYFYGSNKRPKDYFGSSEHELQSFYKALRSGVPGASQLRDLWIDCWKPDVVQNEIYQADGFLVALPNVVKKEHFVRIDGTDFPVQLTEKGTIKKKVSNCANAVHALDSFIVREMQRRASFDLNQLNKTMSLFENYANEASKPTTIADLRKLGKLGELIYIYQQCELPSVRILDYVHTKGALLAIPMELRIKLYEIMSVIKRQGNFELVCIHDNFKCLPKYGNFIRYWYKEILADICESNMIQFITDQISPKKIKFPRMQEKRTKLANEIRNYSNYAIC